MKKHLILGLAAAGLLILAGALLLQQRATRSRGTTRAPQAVGTKPATRQISGTAMAATGAPTSGNTNSNPRPSASHPPAFDLSAAADPVKLAKVASALAELAALYGEAGSLSWDDTKGLVAKRRQASDELVNALAKLGPGGARALAESYGDTQDIRSKRLLVAALARVDDPEAAAALDALLRADDSFSMRKEIVAALGKRPESDSGSSLAGVLQNETDARLRSAGVQALAGRAEALPALSERIRTDGSQDVRLESVHVVGSIANQGAQDLLAGIATGSMETAMRQKAIQELARSSGERALGVFRSLLTDPDEPIRQSAVKAITRFHTDQAVALLQQAAASDASPAIREMARLALPGGAAVAE